MFRRRPRWVFSRSLADCREDSSGAGDEAEGREKVGVKGDEGGLIPKLGVSGVFGVGDVDGVVDVEDDVGLDEAEGALFVWVD